MREHMGGREEASRELSSEPEAEAGSGRTEPVEAGAAGGLFVEDGCDGAAGCVGCDRLVVG